MIKTYRKKPIEIKAMTFNEMLEFAKSDKNLHSCNGVPWSFHIGSHQVSHENDDTYLIPTPEGTMKMTRDDMLITGISGEIYPCKLDIFNKSYDEVL